jgi:hypothetical protein
VVKGYLAQDAFAVVLLGISGTVGMNFAGRETEFFMRRFFIHFYLSLKN